MARVAKRQTGGTVYERKRDGRFLAQITLPTGKQKALPGSWPTRKAATQALAKAVAAQADGHNLGGPERTVEQYLRWWLAEGLPDLRSTTRPTYRYYVEERIIPALGAIKLAQLTPQQVQGFFTTLRTQYADSTVRLIGKILRSAIADACYHNYVLRNVAALAKLPSGKAEDVRPLTIAETQRVFDALDAHPYGAVYTLAAQLGMRRSEVLGLRWQDVDWDANTVAIVGTMHRLLVDPEAKRGKRTAHVRLDTTKTLKSRRTRVMPRLSREALLRHRPRQAAQRLQARAWADTDLVFTREDGSAVDEGMVRKEFHRVLDGLDLPRVKLHALRHGAVSQLIKLGASPKQIQEFVGHARISTTLDIYGHLWDDHAADMAALMDQAYAATV